MHQLHFPNSTHIYRLIPHCPNTLPYRKYSIPSLSPTYVYRPPSKLTDAPASKPRLYCAILPYVPCVLRTPIHQLVWYSFTIIILIYLFCSPTHTIWFISRSIHNQYFTKMSWYSSNCFVVRRLCHLPTRRTEDQKEVMRRSSSLAAKG